MRLHTKRSRFSSDPLRVVLLLLLLWALLLAVFGAACSSERECGGVIIDGVCKKACNDADGGSCAEGARCIENACAASCQDQSDCPAGKNCHLYGFADDSKSMHCVTLDYARGGRIGQYEPCASDNECDMLRGFRCVSGECLIAGCRTHGD